MFEVVQAVLKAFLSGCLNIDNIVLSTGVWRTAVKY
jgi:hypothetical protein